MKEKVILYHRNCPDGFSGAWVAKEKFGDEAQYIGVSHEEPSAPNDVEGKEVYIIDFCYSQEEMQRLLENTKSLTVMDHHATSKKIVESMPNHLFALDHSGATLAWQYFFPQKDVPIFLQYVEDGDIWKFELPQSQDFYAFEETLEFDFDQWSKLVEDFENKDKRQLHLDYGANIRQYQEKIIEDIIKDGEEVTLEGYSALAVNSPVFPSQMGNTIVRKGYDIGITWYYCVLGEIKVSLRSDKNGDVDVAKIAEKYGGGGHKSASGFGFKENEEKPWHPKN